MVSKAHHTRDHGLERLDSWWKTIHYTDSTSIRLSTFKHHQTLLYCHSFVS